MSENNKHGPKKDTCRIQSQDTTFHYGFVVAVRDRRNICTSHERWQLRILREDEERPKRILRQRLERQEWRLEWPNA